jgi:class 3 adenylate cyclase
VDYPPPIVAYLLNRTAKKLHLAYFLLDRLGHIRQWGGALGRYRIQSPQKGMPISQLLTFTEAMFPLTDREMLLECIELPNGHAVDAHIFEADGQPWLLLVDAAEKAENRRLLQQKANELVLLRDVHARILDQHLGRGMTERLLNIDFQKGGERRDLAVLFADIRGFTTYCEHRLPADVFEMLNAYLTAMIRPVLDGGGLVDKIVGDAVMAVFGLLPSSLAASVLAVDAAREIIKSVGLLAVTRNRVGQPVLGVGVGIATGPVVLGILGNKDRKVLSVTGHSVNVAARLESRASSGEILVDQRTFDGLERDRDGFMTKVLELKGMHGPITAYGWINEYAH